jgi:hypothetical protein
MCGMVRPPASSRPGPLHDAPAQRPRRGAHRLSDAPGW